MTTSIGRKIKSARKALSTRKFKERVSRAGRALTGAEPGYRLEVGRFGSLDVAYRAGSADEHVLTESFENDMFLREVREYVPEPTDTVIDIGAHIGTFSLLMATKCPQGVIHAVEASRESHNFVHVNVALNRLDNVRTHHLALSDRKGTARLHHDTGNWGHSITKRLSAHGEEVATDSLGGFMDENAIADCAFMKLNCEGAEFPILLGAPLDVLARVRTMLVLYHLDLADAYDLPMLLDRLHEAGFETRIARQSSLRGWIVATCKA